MGQVRQYAAYALVKVGQNSDVRKQVTEEGGLEPVLYLARTEEPEIQRETLACLCSLSFAEENKMNITRYGGLPPIMSAIRSPDVETARMASCACANLCEVVENMDHVVDAGGIPALVQVKGTAGLGMLRGEVLRHRSPLGVIRCSCEPFRRNTGVQAREAEPRDHARTHSLSHRADGSDVVEWLVSVRNSASRYGAKPGPHATNPVEPPRLRKPPE